MSTPDTKDDDAEEADAGEPLAAAAVTGDASGAAPAKKKKKKKPVADGSAPDGDPSDGATPLSPPIYDPRVREVEVEFTAGDFTRTRAIANDLLGSSDPRLVAVGHDYLRRIGVDPIQLAFLGLCAAALIAIAWIYIPH